MEKSIASRLKRVREALEIAGADALLETHPPNIYYLSGFTGDAGILLVRPTSSTLFTDGRFTIQAQQEAIAMPVKAQTEATTGIVEGVRETAAGCRGRSSNDGLRAMSLQLANLAADLEKLCAVPS